MGAREDLRAAVSDLSSAAVRLPDSAMSAGYRWREYEEEGMRFALLMAYHHLVDLAVLLGATRPPLTQVECILGGFVDAHADLEGLLASASDDEMDRAPAEGEWPIRNVIGHVLSAETEFLGVCRRGLRLARANSPPKPVEDSEWGTFGPRPEDSGNRDEVLASLVRSRDAVLSEFAEISDQELTTPIYFWEATPYELRFRLIRFELHLRQHTVQADKTMAGIGHPPSEAERLVRLAVRGLGMVEAAALGQATAFGAGAIAATTLDLAGLRRDLASA